MTKDRQIQMFKGLTPDPAVILYARHYLGPCKRAQLVWQCERGVLCFRSPSSRSLPRHWMELSRWCIVDGRLNAGSMQWSRVAMWLRKQHAVKTVVSYSDPSVGHTGALYRASGWLWAPTWHRLRPPPSGLGKWTKAGKRQAVKDRWVFPLLPDPSRAEALLLRDAALKRRYPWAEYSEPVWRGKRRTGGGGDYKRFQGG